MLERDLALAWLDPARHVWAALGYLPVDERARRSPAGERPVLVMEVRLGRAG